MKFLRIIAVPWLLIARNRDEGAETGTHLVSITSCVPVFGPPPFTLCHSVGGPCRAPFALPSQWIQGREVEMTVLCQNRANCAGVYRCQIRTYDEEMRGSNGGIDG